MEGESRTTLFGNNRALLVYCLPDFKLQVFSPDPDRGGKVLPRSTFSSVGAEESSGSASLGGMNRPAYETRMVENRHMLEYEDNPVVGIVV